MTEKEFENLQAVWHRQLRPQLDSMMSQDPSAAYIFKYITTAVTEKLVHDKLNFFIEPKETDNENTNSN